MRSPLTVARMHQWIGGGSFMSFRERRRLSIACARTDRMRLPERATGKGRNEMRRLFLFLAAGAALTSQPAQAANFACQADPKAYLAVGGDGLLYTAVNNGSGLVITAICGMSGNDGSTSPQACTAWYSMLLTLRNTGGKALPHFNPGEPTNATSTGCASFSDWQHHVAYFVLAQ